MSTTHTLYRTAIEQLALGCSHTELDIAQRVVAVAAKHPGLRQGDPGYHLIAGGRREFEAALGYRPPVRVWLERGCRRLGIGGYGVVVIVLAAAFLAVPLWLGATGGVLLAVIAAAGFVVASDASVACVNRLATWAFGATTLPGLDLDHGVPASLRTLVAVPTLLTSEAGVANQVARLEIHFLSNGDSEIHYALLTDWTDSATEHRDGDAALLAAAADGIARLNQTHGSAPGGARFLLLHRHRVWNAGEARWIGWERKRGKLHELNRLLRGATGTTFMDPPPVPDGVRYVVTLDSDTRLPRGAVCRLVGKMAHPLNTPRLDAVSGRVVEGHAVLQPRVTPSLPTGAAARCSSASSPAWTASTPTRRRCRTCIRTCSAKAPTPAKGIYDVDAFDSALRGRVADSTLLSHDLFEGVFARAGLVSDIEVVEEFPAGYAVAALRQHRWARGDWQLLPWIVPRSGRAGGARRHPGDGPLEDAGQPAADAVGAGRYRGTSGRLDAAVPGGI